MLETRKVEPFFMGWPFLVLFLSGILNVSISKMTSKLNFTHTYIIFLEIVRPLYPPSQFLKWNQGRIQGSGPPKYLNIFKRNLFRL